MIVKKENGDSGTGAGMTCGTGRCGVSPLEGVRGPSAGSGTFVAETDDGSQGDSSPIKINFKKMNGPIDNRDF